MKLSDLVTTAVQNNCKKLDCRNCVYKDRTFVPSCIVQSDVVLIGEAPGFEEAQQKTPFCGRSGKLLRQLLEEVGIPVSEVSFLNTVSCHPPNNETPSKQVAKRCSEVFMYPQWEQLNPKLTILVGAVALNTFFPSLSIMDKHGSIMNLNGRRFMPVLHPAYCLRNPTATPLLRKDLNKARMFLSGNLGIDRDYVLVTDEEQLLAQFGNICEVGGVISVDIETTTLDPFEDKADVLSIAFGIGEKKSVCIPLNHPENVNVKFKDSCWKIVDKILESYVYKVFHNGIFDVKYLRKFGLEVYGYKYDTMLMAHMLDENRHSISLKNLAAEYLDGYDSEFSSDLKELARYNNSDADNTLRLFKIFNEEMKKNVKMYDLFNTVMMPMCEILIDLEFDGVQIDVEYAEKLKLVYANKIETLHQVIGDQVPEAIGVDLASPKQVADLLFNKLGYDVVKRTEKGNVSVDESVLKKLAEGDCVLAKYMLKLRQCQKMLSTYLEGMIPLVKKDGKIRGSFHVTGTTTGRLSSSKPNLQNIPRAKDIKRLFVAEKNHILMNIDASQSELRVGCSIANETNMISAYTKGMDIHKLTASKALGKPLDKITKTDRQTAKGINFGFLYGQSSEGFQRYAEQQYGLKLSINKCVEFRQSFFESYPRLLDWYKNIEEKVRRDGFIDYPTGWRCRFPQVKGFREIPDDVIRKATNFPVQGSSAQILFYSMVCLDKFIRTNKIDAKFVLTVHDSMVLDLHPDEGKLIMNEVDRICKEDIKKQFSWLKVPMVFDFATGINWGDMAEISK